MLVCPSACNGPTNYRLVPRLLSLDRQRHRKSTFPLWEGVKMFKLGSQIVTNEITIDGILFDLHNI